MTTQYIVICQQIIGGENKPFETAYNFDGRYFTDRKSAIKHGFDIRGSDDFNIGIIKNDKLVQFDWMEDSIACDKNELKEISDYIGLQS
jgi:hypothetical protein